MDVAEFTDLAVQIAAEDTGYNRMWTQAEENLLRSYHGHLTDEQIGELLGRTRIAVEIHWKRELHLEKLGGAGQKSQNIIALENINKAENLRIDDIRQGYERI